MIYTCENSVTWYEDSDNVFFCPKVSISVSLAALSQTRSVTYRSAEKFLLFILSSGESVDEILQLFGNYHQLSEILKEKSNSAGKFFFYTRTKKKFIFSFFVLTCMGYIYIYIYIYVCVHVEMKLNECESIN